MMMICAQLHHFPRTATLAAVWISCQVNYESINSSIILPLVDWAQLASFAY